jgi:hypothetical protein
MCVTNGIHLGSSVLLPVCTVISIQTLKAEAAISAAAARSSGGGAKKRPKSGRPKSAVRPRSEYSLSPDKMSPEVRLEAAVPRTCVATHLFAPSNQDELGFNVGTVLGLQHNLHVLDDAVWIPHLLLA